MSTEAQTTTADADTVSIEINGKQVQAKKGSMVIQAADDAGVYIPRFCYHKKLSVAANCRMCLVEVEKAPKPMPACATPVAEGMKISTQSVVARSAQKSVMEFLLINHPLDCPICDQGGECTLQDLAVGYGGDSSRYLEPKRIIKDKNLGPLIATEMTRCIHCTRCVRFGEEIAGVREMGATGRGEHTKIGTYIEKSVDSELSGNVIDLCPVGALTSKPFRYSARNWELGSHDSVSPHDSHGSNIVVQTRNGRVMRVLPRENEEINETWISDRDRFAYTGLYSDDRLTAPMVKTNGEWQETDWNSALESAVRGLNRVAEKQGPSQVAALASASVTTEEAYLLQKFMRGIGSGNVDHRLRQLDFYDDAAMPGFPGLGCSIADVQAKDAILLVGAHPRKEQPLLGLRLRKAREAGARFMAINPVAYDYGYRPDVEVTGTPQQLLEQLAAAAAALAAVVSGKLPDGIPRIEANDSARAIASMLNDSKNGIIIIGQTAMAHPQSSQLRSIVRAIADMSGATLSFVGESNSAGAWLAGCVPHRGSAGAATDIKGRDAYSLIKDPVQAYLLFGLEPDRDFIDGGRTLEALKAADFVALATAYKPGAEALEHVNVLLPITPFTETAGTFVNGEGKAQSFGGVANPAGEARPGWKVLRVMGNLFELQGFDYNSVEDVRAEIDFAVVPSALAQTGIGGTFGGKAADLVRTGEYPIYAGDSIVRRAVPLQETMDNPGPLARMNASQASKQGVSDGDRVRVRMLEGDAEVELMIDNRIPDGCVWLPSGYAETSRLGAYGPASVTKL
ncbi:MAG: NADH-quinone oxidoreductase subunit NuoG [Gammaproteobacteria bacterium]|nr:NADH-quinone oxidoreductase subunit NuoG [Gammaproteobacteria bacterium]